MAGDSNPWARDSWSLTEQMGYVRRFGPARAEARARDAGTTLGGGPAAAKAPAARPPDPTNPWSAAGWSVTAQMAYIREHGLARAEARARDAGTTTLATRPPLAAAALVRPGSNAIYRVGPDGAAYVPQRRRKAATTIVTLNLPPLTAGLGVTQSVAGIYTEQRLAAAAALGLTMTAPLNTNTLNFKSSHGLGLTETVSITREVDITAGPLVWDIGTAFKFAATSLTQSLGTLSPGVRATPAAALMVVAMRDDATVNVDRTCSDSVNGAYTRAIISTDLNGSAANGRVSIFYKWNAAALKDTDTITVTASAACNIIQMSAYYSTGIQTASNPGEGFSGNAGNGTFISGIAGTTVTKGDLVTFALGTGNIGTSDEGFVQDTADGWRAPFDRRWNTDGTRFGALEGAYQVQDINTTNSNSWANGASGHGFLFAVNFGACAIGFKRKDPNPIEEGVGANMKVAGIDTNTRNFPSLDSLGITMTSALTLQPGLVHITSNESGFNSTMVTTTGLAVPAGALILVAERDDSATVGNRTCIDSKGNVYTRIGQVALNGNTGNGATAMFYAWNCIALTATDTITVASPGTAEIIQMTACYCGSGVLNLADPNDTVVTATNSGVSTTPTVTSGTPGQSNELFVASLGTGITEASDLEGFNQDTTHGWVTPFNRRFNSDGTRGGQIVGGNQVNTGTGAKTFSPTINTSMNWGTIVTGFYPSTDINLIHTQGDVIGSVGAVFSLLTTADTPAGSLIVVETTETSNNAGPGTLTDDAGNTYTALITKNPAGLTAQGFTTVWYCNNCLFLSATQHIKYTPVTTGSGVSVQYYAFSNASASANPFDATVTASLTGNANTFSFASGAPTVKNEYLLGMLHVTTNSGNWGFPLSPFNVNNFSFGSFWHINNGSFLCRAKTAQTLAANTGGAAGGPFAAIVVGIKPF